MNEQIVVNLDEFKEQLLNKLTERAIRVCTVKSPHTYLKAVGTREIEKILNEEFDKLK